MNRREFLGTILRSVSIAPLASLAAVDETPQDGMPSLDDDELATWYKYWFAVGSCCQPADRGRAESAITRAYGYIKESRPEFIWADSPYSCLSEIAKHSLNNGYWDHARTIWSAIRSWPSYWMKQKVSSLNKDQKINAKLKLLDSLGISFGTSSKNGFLEADSRGYCILNRMEGSLGRNLDIALRQHEQYLPTDFWGQFDVSWIALYLFFQKMGIMYGDEEGQALDIWSELAHSCSWWWPFRDVCVVSERPLYIKWNEVIPSLIHCDGSPAVEFRDGWQVWAFDGELNENKHRDACKKYRLEIVSTSKRLTAS